MDVEEVVIAVKSEEIGDNDELVFIYPRAGPHLIKHQVEDCDRHKSQAWDKNWEDLAVIENYELMKILGELAIGLDRCIYDSFAYILFKINY